MTLHIWAHTVLPLVFHLHCKVRLHINVRRGHFPERRALYLPLGFSFLLSTDIFFFFCICNCCIPTKSITLIAYSLYETRPQGTMVVEFIKTNIQSYIGSEHNYNCTMIPCSKSVSEGVGHLYSNQKNKMGEM